MPLLPCSAPPLWPHRPIRLPFLVFFLIIACAAAAAAPPSVVSHLPGFPGPLPFHLETGYVEVDEVNGGELFYYFIESEGEPNEDPLLLWLTGGPRCSALSGLVFEVGPLRFITAKYNGSLPSLTYHPYSWTQIASIIFLDSPVGSGFSFSQQYEGYYVNDTIWSQHAHKFLIKGDSYGGKIVPILAQSIVDGIDTGKESLNFQGYVIGSLVTGGKVDSNAQVPFAHGMGIISDAFFEVAQKNCRGQGYRSPTNAQCAGYMDTFNLLLSKVNRGYILEFKCDTDAKLLTVSLNRRRILKQMLDLHGPPPFPDLRCRTYAYVLSYYWANHDTVRQALHIKKDAPIKEWRRCRVALPYEKGHGSNIKYHHGVLSKGYRALVYSGDHDALIPFLGTQQWIRSLNASVVDEWRSWLVDGQIAGYTEAYSNNLTFATVKNGGHTAPEYQPKECLAMIRRWISREALRNGSLSLILFFCKYIFIVRLIRNYLLPG